MMSYKRSRYKPSCGQGILLRPKLLACIKVCDVMPHKVCFFYCRFDLSMYSSLNNFYEYL